ncbi:MAG: tetratricopeptide repeat protein [Nitrospirota bacterium]
MPKVIKKKAARKKTVQEDEVKSVAFQAVETLKQKQKHAIIAVSAIIGIVIIYVAFSLYSSSMTKKAYALEQEAYSHYYSEPTDETAPVEDKWKKAVDLFKESFDLKATPTAAFYLGNSYFNLNDYDNAIKEYSSFIDRFSSETAILPLVYQKLASSLFKTGQNEKALETLGKLAKIEKGIFRDSALVLEARHYETTGAKDKALEKYREVLADFPASPWGAEANSKITADEKAKAPKDAAPVKAEPSDAKAEKPAAEPK